MPPPVLRRTSGKARDSAGRRGPRSPSPRTGKCPSVLYSGRHREHVHALEKIDSLRAIHFAAILEVAVEAVALKAGLDVVKILLVFGRKIPRR